MPIYKFRFKPKIGKLRTRTSAPGGGSKSLIPTANLQLWFRASSINQSDSTAVSTWNDESGNGRHITQGTGANQPIFKLSQINGKPVVEFDGVDDFMSRTSVSNFSSANQVVAFLVMKIPSDVDCIQLDWQAPDTTNRVTLSALNANPDRNFLFIHGNQGSGGLVQSGTISSGWLGVTQIAEWTRNGSAVTLRSNNVDLGSGSMTSDVTPGSSATLFIGQNTAGAGQFGGQLAELIYYNRFLTTAERDQVRNYLNGKYAAF